MTPLYPLDRVCAEAIPDPELISDEHVRQFRVGGFIACDGVFPAERVTSAKAAVRDLISRNDPPFPHLDLEKVTDAQQASGPEQRTTSVSSGASWMPIAGSRRWLTTRRW